MNVFPQVRTLLAPLALPLYFMCVTTVGLGVTAGAVLLGMVSFGGPTRLPGQLTGETLGDTVVSGAVVLGAGLLVLTVSGVVLVPLVAPGADRRLTPVLTRGVGVSALGGLALALRLWVLQFLPDG